MKHYISILLFVTLCAVCSCTSDTDSVNQPPTVTTGECKSATRESATVESTIIQNGASINSYGIVYAKDPQMLVNPTLIPCDDELNASSTTFTTNIKGLTSGTTYFYRTYVKSGNSYYYGEFKTFSTPTVSAPSFAGLTIKESDVQATEAKFVTAITDEGFGSDFPYLEVTSASIRYKQVADGTAASSVTFDNNWATAPATYSGDPKAANNFEGTVTGLKANTTYAACAYASSAGFGISDIVVFKTKEIPADLPQVGAMTLTASDQSGINVNISSAIVSEGSDPVTAYGFIYSSTNKTPQLLGKECSIIEADGDFRAVKDGLSNSTTYYFRAYATNKNGTSYSEVFAYTTPDATKVPNVYTVTCNNITSKSATLVGLVNRNNVEISSVGFYVNDKSYTATLSESGTFSLTVEGLDPDQTYVYVAFCKVGGKEYKGSAMTFKTSKATPSSGDIDFPEY